ncbi:MAG: hypothetical protein R3351_01200 [Nitrospirales bacterium]|nr:hypothetical protein [Nitrospirales bacterium]
MLNFHCCQWVYLMRLVYSGFLLATGVWLAGCSSIAEGVTTALIKSNGEKGPGVQCEVVGPAFKGIGATMPPESERSSGSGIREAKSKIKVMVVHGIGPARPDYSVRLQRNLTRELGLTVRSRRSKRIKLRDPEFKENDLGTLTISRYLNNEGTQEILFYELVWAEITAHEKRVLNFDTSGRYQSRRASVNHTAKGFLNDRISDPLIYVGESHIKILKSVDQAMCWTLYANWSELPDGAAQVCNRHEVASVADLQGYKWVVITHSLGSRIVIDTMEFQARVVLKRFQSEPDAMKRNKALNLLRAWKNETIQVYMLANQLPLLQLGRGEPEVFGQFDSYCRPEGSHYDERIVKELQIVAFSDPNDLLSYAIPPAYADEYMDSRLCPTVVNVSVNVVPTFDLFKVGQIADPLSAHTEYDNNHRVIGLITRGVGNSQGDQAKALGCEWMKTVED